MNSSSRKVWNTAALLSAVMVLSACSVLSADKASSGLSAAAGNHNALAFKAQPDLATRLSSAERVLLSNAELQALDFGAAGEAVSWSGQQAGTNGSVRAFQLYRVGANACRRFEHSVLIGAESDRVTGTACRRRDNSWRLVE